MFNKLASSPSEYWHSSNDFPIMTSSPVDLCKSASVCMCVFDVSQWLAPDSLIEKVHQSIACMLAWYPHTLVPCQRVEHHKCFSLLLSSNLVYVKVIVCVCVFATHGVHWHGPLILTDHQGREEPPVCPKTSKHTHTHPHKHTLPNITISIFTYGQCIPPRAA